MPYLQPKNPQHCPICNNDHDVQYCEAVCTGCGNTWNPNDYVDTEQGREYRKCPKCKSPWPDVTKSERKRRKKNGG